MSSEITVEVAGPGKAEIERARQSFLESKPIRQALQQGAKLLHFAVREGEKSDRSTPGRFDQFEAVLYNYKDSFSLKASGALDAPEQASLVRSAMQPLPTASELSEAIKVASKDKRIGDALAAGRAQLFPAMPGIIAQDRPDGSKQRLISLVLHPESPAGIPEILGVDLGSGQLARGLATHPARAEYLQDRILPIPKIPVHFLNENDVNHVWLTIRDPGNYQVLWKMLVVRPAASSGLNGSGLELRYVDYKGKRVLYRAHAPIWNVLYQDRIQEYRDWTNQESGFQASGTPFTDAHGNKLDHFLLCNSEPQTPFETGTDGPFTGVAVHKNADQSWTVSTMMAAGWYRYYMAYTFFPDGTVKPRVGFTTNGSNPYAGKTHYHNCYFRFDFDIDGASNDIVETDNVGVHWDPVTHQLKMQHSISPILFEKKANRTTALPLLFHTNYRVRDKQTERGFWIMPRAVDGTAAADTYNFSKGDIWVTRYKGNEVDDGVPELSKPADAQIDKFLTGESVDGADIVFWYGVHFSHDPNHTTGEKDFGPDLHTHGAW